MSDQSATMQAVRFTDVGAPLLRTTLPVPRPEPGWALVRVRAVAICGSDVHILEGHTPVGFTPITLGHEISGDVVELGEGAVGQGADVGDRVFINPIIGCGRCRYCATEESNFCPDRGLLGIHFEGAMAEYVVAPVRNLTTVPDRISHAEIAMVESAGTAYHAIRVLDAEPGDAVVVIGAGGLGLQTVRIATALGLRVVSVDPNAAARERALAAGAERAYSPEDLRPGIEDGGYIALAEEMGSPFGFAHAVDCVGFEETVNLALGLLRPRGSCSIIGIGAAGVRLPDPAIFVRRSLQVRGIYTYSSTDIADVIELLVAGRLELADSVSLKLPLAEAQRAFAAFVGGDVRPVRVVLEP